MHQYGLCVCTFFCNPTTLYGKIKVIKSVVVVGRITRSFFFFKIDVSSDVIYLPFFSDRFTLLILPDVVQTYVDRCVLIILITTGNMNVCYSQFHWLIFLFLFRVLVLGDNNLTQGNRYHHPTVMYYDT